MNASCHPAAPIQFAHGTSPSQTPRLSWSESGTSRAWRTAWSVFSVTPARHDGAGVLAGLAASSFSALSNCRSPCASHHGNLKPHYQMTKRSGRPIRRTTSSTDSWIACTEWRPGKWSCSEDVQWSTVQSSFSARASVSATCFASDAARCPRKGSEAQH